MPCIINICIVTSSSMFGIWGSRTENQKLFSARNLDWNKDSGRRPESRHCVLCFTLCFSLGINKLKVITVYKPSDGAYAHATVGFVPLYGALAGMSASGITGITLGVKFV